MELSVFRALRQEHNTMRNAASVQRSLLFRVHAAAGRRTTKVSDHAAIIRPAAPCERQQRGSGAVASTGEVFVP